jgi:hypothetical protein
MITYKEVYVPPLFRVEKYLKETGWTLFSIGRHMNTWQKGMESLYVPTIDSANNYEREMWIVFNTLGDIEKRDSYDIWRDVVVSEWENE